MNTTLKIAAAQYPITYFSSFDEWKNHTQKWIASATEQGAQVLLFPEYGSMELVSVLYSQGQSKLNLKEQVKGLSSLYPEALAFYTEQAKQNQIAIIPPSFPVLTKDHGKPVNRCHFISPTGEIGFQDKWHMTRFEDEEWGVTSGSQELSVFSAFGVKFGINICFDVEFAFAAQNLNQKGVQVLLAPSCTESAKGMNRVHIGARARALENQCYVVVAQTVGNANWSEAVDINTGQAAFYSTCDQGFPDDGILAQGELQKEQWLIYDLDLTKIDLVRKQGQVFNWQHNQRYKWSL